MRRAKTTPIHWYNTETEKTVCGLSIASAGRWLVDGKPGVSCKRCLHGLAHGWGKKEKAQ